jgi:hypothetical protein
MSAGRQGWEVIKDHTRARGISERKMAKKGGKRNEWKTKQPRLLQFQFFNLFFSPSKEIRGNGLKQ